MRASLEAWAKWYEKHMECRNVQTTKVHGALVSTVFLAIDHDFTRKGPPILWETMIFDGPEDGYQERYSSLEDAIIGHKVAVEIAKRAHRRQIMATIKQGILRPAMAYRKHLGKVWARLTWKRERQAEKQEIQTQIEEITQPERKEDPTKPA